MGRADASKTESCSACQGLIMHAQLPHQGNAKVNLTGLVRRVGTRTGNLDGPGNRAIQ